MSKKKYIPPIPGAQKVQTPQPIQLPTGEQTMNNCAEIGKFLLTVGQQYNMMYQELMRSKASQKPPAGS